MVAAFSVVAPSVSLGRQWLVGGSLVLVMVMIVVVVTRHPVPPAETAQVLRWCSLLAFLPCGRICRIGIAPFPQRLAVWPLAALIRAEE
jgi:hypothetical protein